MTVRTRLLDQAVGQAMSGFSATARKGLGQHGVRESQLDLPAWEEAEGAFSERERAALALTEAVTVLTDGCVADEVYDRAAAQFGEAGLARLVALTAAVDNWNRVMVTRRVPPGGYTP